MKIYSFILALTLSATTFASAQAPAADYIRYRKAGVQDQPDVLETATSRFIKGNHTLDLISVVHLGDAQYFEQLKNSLVAYDAVFYEMVGGPYTPEKAKLSKEAASPDDSLAKVQGLQQMAKNILGLEFQLDGLDYLAPNFVHADMTQDEFSEHTGEGGGISELISKAVELAQSGKIPGIPSTEEDANQLMSQLMGAVLTGDSNQLKRSLGPILAEAEAFITQLEGENGTVLISKRNEVVVKKVAAHVASRGPGPKHDAILYGAGHMADLEKRFQALGYMKSETVWQPSWIINQGASQNTHAPTMNEILNQIGGLMKMMKGG